jgi:predicted GIY-YIG superfamily endonuclease
MSTTPLAGGGPLGIVYLLHFARPYRHARHYTGWTEDLLDRLDKHARGHGARLMNVISQAGIGFTLARTCEGTRATERAIKNNGGAVRFCPLCTSRPWNGPWGPCPADLIPRYYPCDPAEPRWVLLPDLVGRQATS